MRRLAPPLHLGLLALCALLAVGCEIECENADGSKTPFTGEDTRHCGHCGNACAVPGMADEDVRCVDLIGCEPIPGRACAPGYHDLDPDRAGCECFGPSPELCTPCGEVDLPHTGLDEDCDLRIDEQIVNRTRFPRPINGSGGAQPPTRLLSDVGAPARSRAVCGDDGAACVLSTAGADVRCVRQGESPTCVSVAPAEPVATTRRPLYTEEVDCTDGVDDDGNGVIDDGPTCQTLVAAVAAPECHGRTPGPDCPPSYVPLDPTQVRLPGAVKPLVAQMTYDVLLDNTEATVGQVRRFLEEDGRCDNPPGQNHPLCAETGDPTLPAGGLDWCTAYDYCRAAGKRLPTELEWLHAFGEARAAVSTGETCAASGQTTECGADGPRPVGQIGGHASRGLDGEAVITDAVGNVAEWLYDAVFEPCAAPWADCLGPVPTARYMPIDPALDAPADDPERPRLLRGGGWGSELGAASVQRRQFAEPGVEVAHYGVRCAQTFRPLPLSAEGVTPIEQVPYDSTIEADRHASCVPRPKTRRLAPRTPPHRLFRGVAACVVGADSVVLDDMARSGFAGSAPLLFSVTDEFDGAATIAVETGLVPGAEAFWLDARPPTLTLVEHGCTPFGCAFDRSTEPGTVTLPGFDGSLNRLPFLGARPIAGAMPTCLPRAPFGEAHWRLELQLPRAVLEPIFQDVDGPAAACAALRCVIEVPPDRCTETCPAWRLPVDVEVELLTVP